MLAHRKTTGTDADAGAAGAAFAAPDAGHGVAVEIGLHVDDAAVMAIPLAWLQRMVVEVVPHRFLVTMAFDKDKTLALNVLQACK